LLYKQGLTLGRPSTAPAHPPLARRLKEAGCFSVSKAARE